jgi:hypothetical protein
LGTGTSLTVCPSTCTPVEAIPPPVSLKPTAMLCTPLTGEVELNIGLEGPELMTGTAVSLSVMSAREIRIAAASAAATFWQGAFVPGTQDT